VNRPYGVYYRIDCGGDHRSPVFLCKTNFLADRVLAVPSRLRQQKRALRSHRPSVRNFGISFCDFCASAFWRGAGEPFSRKRFPCKSPKLLRKMIRTGAQFLCSTRGQSEVSGDARRNGEFVIDRVVFVVPM